ncbi:putative tRNA pseudouridine synthase Pus10 [Orussus abietinus]|uniref:putative tRNA pseudouridine synthase Pus10 n=1 Tax=Orussus abietinus TaxID=222816 RepID=UPI000626862B|nr:putative tRNA pseudouridine synthase Pus10 [Orussus abietinus]XP_023287510.1 putative tRNA pseudouridine synthase Pus10 [Orussus abietinus]
MNSSFFQNDKEAFTFMRQCGCCLRCCLRFTGYRNLQCYEDPISTVKNLKYIDEHEKVVDENICIICLGFLHDSIQDEALTKISEAVGEGDYDSDTFSCSLTIPTVLPVRERLMNISLVQKHPLLHGTQENFIYRIQNIKDIWKFLITPKVETVLQKKVEVTAATSSLVIDIFITYADDDKECKALLYSKEQAMKTNTKRKRKHNATICSKKNIETMLNSITDNQLLEYCKSPPSQPVSIVVVDKVTCLHRSIYIGGRYNKFSRELSQTPWFIDGHKKMETSVQELLCQPIMKYTKADSMKFLSSGREDVDVRTIYYGRPFAVELVNPKVTKITDETLLRLNSIINDSSKQIKSVTDLKLLSKTDLNKLKLGEVTKSKTYRALCLCRNGLNDFTSLEKLNHTENLKIVQKTPTRVLHRRPLTPRIRIIHKMRANWIEPEKLQNVPDSLITKLKTYNQYFFILDIKTQAGTYVKEFVHGDFGRTKPNLCNLLNADVDIVTLDVTSINLDWP